jgi:hypothetical protein
VAKEIASHQAMGGQGDESQWSGLYCIRNSPSCRHTFTEQPMAKSACGWLGKGGVGLTHTISALPNRFNSVEYA